MWRLRRAVLGDHESVVLERERHRRVAVRVVHAMPRRPLRAVVGDERRVLLVDHVDAHLVVGVRLAHLRLRGLERLLPPLLAHRVVDLLALIAVSQQPHLVLVEPLARGERPLDGAAHADLEQEQHFARLLDLAVLRLVRLDLSGWPRAPVLLACADAKHAQEEEDDHERDRREVLVDDDGHPRLEGADRLQQVEDHRDRLAEVVRRPEVRVALTP